MQSHFERSIPEREGISSRAIAACVERVRALPDHTFVNSLMIVRHGKVIHENYWAPYRADCRRQLYSLSKSFTSTAVGFAIQEGYFGLDDRLVDLFSDKLPTDVSETLQKVTVRHILTMSGGHARCYADQVMKEGAEDWQRAFLSKPFVHEPGSVFVYNSLGTYMLSALIRRKTGMGLVDYLMPRLFEPLELSRPVWDTCPCGIEAGGWGLHLTTEEIAKFGQLYLQRGCWNGRQIIPEAWLDMATAKQISNGSAPNNDWSCGYGFQFWRCQPEGVYRGDGAFGQNCVIMPRQDAVIITTGSVGNLQAVLTAIWDTLLPAFQDHPLPEDPEAVCELWTLSQNLEIERPLMVAAEQPAAFAGCYRFDANSRGYATAELTFEKDHCEIALTMMDGAVKRIRFGLHRWIQNGESIEDGRLCAGAMGWTADHELTLAFRCIEGPFDIRWTFRNKEDGTVEIDPKRNFNFMNVPLWEPMTLHRC